MGLRRGARGWLGGWAAALLYREEGGVAHAGKSDALYSIDDIARMTRVAHHNIARAIEEEGGIKNKAQLTDDELDRVLDRIAAINGLSDSPYTLPDYLRTCSSAWCTTLVRMYDERITAPTCLAPEQGEVLATLVRNAAPRTIVEIGCNIGVSTIWMAAALEQVGGAGVVHAIDMFGSIKPAPPYHYRYIRDMLTYAQQCVESAQLSHRVNFHVGDSTEIGRNIHKVTRETIDLLFIDGDHKIEGCLSDFLLYAPHVSAGGYIVLHDIYPEHCGFEGPRHLIDQVVKRVPWFDVVEIRTHPNNYGMAIISKLA